MNSSAMRFAWGVFWWYPWLCAHAWKHACEAMINVFDPEDDDDNPEIARPGKWESV